MVDNELRKVREMRRNAVLLPTFSAKGVVQRRTQQNLMAAVGVVCTWLVRLNSRLTAAVNQYLDSVLGAFHEIEAAKDRADVRVLLEELPWTHDKNVAPPLPSSTESVLEQTPLLQCNTYGV